MAKILFLLIFIDAVKLQKEPEKKHRARVTLHYGDEIQSIVEAIADTIDGFWSSWNVQCNGTRNLCSFLAVLIILPLSIITQEIRNFSHSFFQNFNSWQIYHPEMVRLLPVKSLPCTIRIFLSCSRSSANFSSFTILNFFTSIFGNI